MKNRAISHFFFCDMAYNSSMKRMKLNFKHFLFLFFMIFVPCTASFAAPASEVFPPIPFEQELPEEDFPDRPRRIRPPRDPDNIIHYRGNRAYAENLPLEIVHTRCERKAEDVVSLIIFFNQSINPRSMKADSFSFNNKPLPFGTRFNFNKKGNSVRMLLPVKENTFKLKVQNISSFDGKDIEPVELLIEVDSE